MMKIHFEPKDFLRKFKIAASIVSAKEAPILQNVRITADKRLGAILTATDTAVGIRIRVDCDVTEEGTAIVPIKQFRHILELETPQDWYSVTLSGFVNNTIQIESEQTDCQLDVYSPVDFPILDAFTAESYHETSAEGLHRAIKRTIFAVEKNSASALCGVCFENFQDDQQKDVIQLVATDGRRIAIQTLNSKRVGDHVLGLTVGESPAPHTIVPVKCLKLLDKVLKEKSLDCAGRLIKIAVIRRKNVSQIMFQCGDVTVFSDLIANRYPHWRGMLSELKSEESLFINIETGALLTAIKRVEAVFCGSDTGIVLRFDVDQLTVSEHGKESGTTKAAVPATCNGMGFAEVDSTFLTSMLKTLDSDTTLTILMNGYDPICVSLNGDEYLYFMMPTGTARTISHVEVNGMDIGKMIEQRRKAEIRSQIESAIAGENNTVEESESSESTIDENTESEEAWEDEESEEEFEDEESDDEDEPENEESSITAQIEAWTQSGEQKESTPVTTSVSCPKDLPAVQEPPKVIPKENEETSSKRKQFTFME
jgi:DNA polymerase III sliding clamp (beta) subunit (PCNA family)